MRKKVSINKIIKKVNKDISIMCAANGFCFTCNDMIDVSMLMVANFQIFIYHESLSMKSFQFFKIYQRFDIEREKILI